MPLQLILPIVKDHAIIAAVDEVMIEINDIRQFRAARVKLVHQLAAQRRLADAARAVIRDECRAVFGDHLVEPRSDR